ncbi:MAG TPA: Ig-like domain-containing protein [Mycobacteriales bacterium]|nr:Ig-like domain-containing protein [Mycobacteriales bacterium]
MNTIIRACAAGALATVVLTTAGTAPASASTEAVGGAGLLAAPAGLTPDDTGTPYPHAARKDVTLDWAPVPGATGYRVQVGRDATWSDEASLTKDVKISEWTLPQSLPYATYVWRVAALNGGALGHWSSESGQAHSDASFTRGWRAAPVLDAVAVPYVGRPTFSWSQVAGADAYELQVSSTPFGAGSATGPTPDTSPSPTTQTQPPDTLVAECFTPRTRVTPASDEVGQAGTAGKCDFALPQDGSTLYWRVRALAAFVGEGATGATVPVSSAGISSTAPNDDNLGELCGANTPGFECEPARAGIAGNWSAPGSYVATPATPAGAVTTTVTTTSLGADPDGLCTVVTDATPTEAEHAVCRDVPTIRWAEVSGATKYRLTFALDDEMTNIQHVVASAALQFTVPGSWADASPTTSYYYAVQACSSTCGPVTTTPPSFSKATPRLTVGSAPGVTGEIHFTWQSYAAALAAATGQEATQDAYAYHVQVAPSDHPSYDVLADEQLVDETFYAPQKSYADGSYVWRVQPVDGAGNKLPWSTSQSFTRDATPPKVVSVSPSSGVEVTQPLKLVFSEPVTGASSSSVTLSPATTTTLTVTGPTTATLTPVKLVPGATYRVVVSSAVHDLSGNVADPLGPTFTVKALVNDTSKAFSYGGTWRTFGSSSAIGGGYHGSTPTSTAKTSATTRFAGVGVGIYSCLGPASGYLDIYVDGVKKGRVSLYRSYSGCGIKVAAVSGLARTTHTLKLVGVGSHVSSSKGNAVSVDAVKVTP